MQPTITILFDEESTLLNVDVLKDLCSNNAEYFAKDTSENGQRLYISFMAIKDHVDLMVPKVRRIGEKAPLFDFDEETPGNGFRSFLSVVDSAIAFASRLNKTIISKRAGTFFRRFYAKEMEACAHLFASLDTCLKHLETLMSWCEDGNLFPKDDHSPQELLSSYEDINQYCFYGRCLGFQFCESIQGILQLISLSMAIFSEMYYNQGSFLSRATGSLAATTKYLHDPEQRARRIVNISQNAGVDFCKSFWFLSENVLMTNVPYVVASSVAVSKIINLPPEPFTLLCNTEDDDGDNREDHRGEKEGRPAQKEIEIPVPESHIGRRPIQVRLMSYRVHEGMIGVASKRTNTRPPSRGLLVHCHGGGFVAQSSLSHECYLREWAKRLEVPILSVDYSLAPEAPYPRALEEVTYAYCWAVKNCRLLGSTGERIIAAGDSAGANLILGATLKCLDLGVPPPMGLFLAYAPTLVDFNPSPARLLCMMDPLLPFGFMMRCLKAYACPPSSSSSDTTQPDSNLATATTPENGLQNGGETSDTESFEEISESDLMELQAHKSSISETSDTLTYGSLDSVNNALLTGGGGGGGGGLGGGTMSVTGEGATAAAPAAEEEEGEDEDNNVVNGTVIGAESNSEKYVSDFLEKYVLDSDTDTDGTKVVVLRKEEAAGVSKKRDGKDESTTASASSHRSSSAEEDPTSLQAKVSNFVSQLRGRFGNWMSQTTAAGVDFMNYSSSQSGMSAAERYLDAEPHDGGLLDEFDRFQVPKDPYLSPYFALDEDLMRFPPVRVLTVHMDPCLDDCIMFAKRLKKLDKDVKLNLLSGLPHGFLNFAMISKDAFEGSKVCIDRLIELLDIDNLPPLE